MDFYVNKSSSIKYIHNLIILTLQALQGCLVLLTEIGELSLCYLGTAPMIFMAPERPIKDYKDTKNELIQLKKDLQNMSLQDGKCFLMGCINFYFEHRNNTIR